MTVRAARVVLLVTALAGVARAQAPRQLPSGSHAHQSAATDSLGRPLPHVMRRDTPMLVGLTGVVPNVTPFLPGRRLDPATLAVAKPRELVQLRDGDTLELRAMLVRRTVNGKTFTMYGFNGQYPGPLIRVAEQATVTVRFLNQIDMPSTIHWHGVRVENRFDGVPELTQPPVAPGASFTYRVRFPDPGIYWYHPHVREDIQQDLGLYGNMLVDSRDRAYYAPANREEVLMLDDIVIEGDTLVPYGLETPNYALMGRFGTTMLVNGEPHYHLTTRRGEVVRFFLTNVSSTRIFNVSFGKLPVKVVASDMSRFEREEIVSSVVIAPAERYVVDVHFPTAGTHQIANRVQALDHFNGEFFDESHVLGMVDVVDTPATPDHGASFSRVREHADVVAELVPFRRHFERAPDHELTLTLQTTHLPLPIFQFFSIDTAYFRPIEWSDAMPDMNWVTTGREVRWILRDKATGKENMDVHWRFKQGDVVKIRVTNDVKSLHPMSHPIHLHGQRFLVVAKDGVSNHNLVWKDTILVPVGATFDLLVEMSNPGTWMTHCHIAEHLQTGMMSLFTVEPAR